MPPSDDIKVIKDRRPTKADSTQKEWDAVYHAAAQCDPLACCLIELRDRLSTLQQQVDSGPKVCIRPATTADGLSPVEPAPKAPQGVTVEELVDCLPNPWKGDLDSFARHLLAHDRLGPLLRGEGYPAPKRVLLPEEPNNGPALYELNRTRDRGCFLAGWRSARAEAFRVGGQAIHAPAPKPVVLPEEPPALAHVNNGYATNPAFKHGYLAGWYSLRVEIARQQGGQADG
jgi:hypothetical protein